MRESKQKLPLGTHIDAALLELPGVRLSIKRAMPERSRLQKTIAGSFEVVSVDVVEEGVQP